MVTAVRHKNPAYEPRHGEIRSVTESRLLGLLKFHQFTHGAYMAGARANTLHILDYAGFYICRAVQLWQLLPDRYAVIWIDIGADGVDIFNTAEKASEKFMQVRAGLRRRPPPAVLGPYNQKPGEH